MQPTPTVILSFFFVISLFQDNRILAELEHPRTTGPGGGGGMSSVSSHHLTSSIGSGLTSSNVPTCMSYSATVGAGGFMSALGGVTSSTSSHALTSQYDGLTGDRSGTSGLGNVTISTANVSPLPVRAHHMNTMPPLCQVCIFCFVLLN